MNRPGVLFTLFDTAIGRCGIAWRGEAITGLVLPGPDEVSLAGRLAIPSGGTPPAAMPPASVAAIIRQIQEHLEGRLQDFSGVPLDLDRVTPFRRTVYEAARHVPSGQVITYGELARRIGRPVGARAVGGALGKNPVAILVPCHRIVGADGSLTGFSAPGGTGLKQRLLEIEGTPPGAAGKNARSPR